MYIFFLASEISTKEVMATSKTYFNDEWLKEFWWLKEIPDDQNAVRCSLCNAKIQLSNMGRRAITSHQDSKKHRRKEASASMCYKISNSKASVHSTEQTVPAFKESKTEETQQNTNVATESSSNVPPDKPECSNTKVVLPGIKKYLLKEDISKAEILWCLQAIATHKSLRSAEKDVKLFSEIFKDSAIAKGMQLGRDKMKYFIIFGIAPIFRQNLIQEILLCDHFVIGFDESLNKISQRQQMDLNVRYWCKEVNEVKTRYLNSVFLGRSCAEDLLASFQNASKPLQLKKLLQVSMDGPNVNNKFFKELVPSIKEVPEDPEVLNIGSCGLHSINVAFKTGAKSTNWEIFVFMRALYYVFKDSPARRALYTSYTHSQEFPKKFCSVRWLENSEVAERCLNILPNVKLFIDNVEKDKSAPSSESYLKVKRLVNDPLLPAKLAFFYSVSSDFETFLREYQTDVPLIPFLYDDLSALLLRIMKRFIVNGALKGNLLQVDVDNTSNFIPCKEIDVGISALCNIKKDKISETQLISFYKDCRKFLISCVKKLQDRSPLTYKLTKAVSCFNPTAASKQTIFEKRLTMLLVILCEKNWIGPISADRAKHHLKEVCSAPHTLSKLKSYKKSERIDRFWYDLLSSEMNPCDDAINVVKMIMILSHGNSNIERGFSINKDCLWENMKEEAIVARRIIYDALKVHGGVENIDVTKEMVLSVRNSRSRYEEEREKKMKEEKETKQNLKRKRETEIQLKELQAKK